MATPEEPLSASTDRLPLFLWKFSTERVIGLMVRGGMQKHQHSLSITWIMGKSARSLFHAAPLPNLTLLKCLQAAPRDITPLPLPISRLVEEYK